MPDTDIDTYYAIASSLIPVLARERSGWKVSKQGLIQTPSGEVTKGSLTSDSSYIIMVPATNGTDIHLRVDRLVSMTFDAGSHTNDTDLYHLDDDIQNNRIDNLRPMTRDQFSQHKYRKQVKKEVDGVDQYDLDGNFLQTFDSCRKAKMAIGDAKDDPSLGIHIRDNRGPYKGFVYRLRDNN